MDEIIIPMNETAKADEPAKPSLQTLDDIRTYVDAPTFDLSGLARGLGRDRAKLWQELEWLMRNGYIEYASEGRASLRLTMKGRTYESGDEETSPVETGLDET